MDFHGSATNPALAYIALYNTGGSIFSVTLAEGALSAIGAMNTGPLGALGRVRSIATVDDIQIYVAIDTKPGLFSLSTSSNPIPTLRAGQLTTSGDLDAVGTLSRFGVVKNLCRSADKVYIYFTTWAPYKLLRFHTITYDVRTIAGLALSVTPTTPVPIDGYPPNSALAWPTTLQASLDGKTVYVLEYRDQLSAPRYDSAHNNVRQQQWLQLRSVSLATGFITTIPVSDGSYPHTPYQILLAVGQSTTLDFEQPTPLAMSRSYSITESGAEGSHLFVGRPTRIRVMALNSAPIINDIKPRVLRASIATTITLTGFGFGSVSTDLLGINYRDQGLFATTDTSITGSAMPTSTACGALQWVDSTQVRCTLTPSAALGQRLSFRVIIATSDGSSRYFSRHSIVELRTIPVPVVSGVEPAVGPAADSRKLVLRTTTRMGFGTAADACSVIYGAVGSTTGTACTSILPVDEYAVSCIIAANTVAGTQYWFSVAVAGHSPTANPAVTQYVNSFTAVAGPTLTSVCPTASTAVGRQVYVTLVGTNLGTSIDNVVITVGPTGVEYMCSLPTFVSGGGLGCIIPATLPLNIGLLQFKVSVRGVASAVSSFTFNFASTATVSGNPSAAVITSISPTTGLMPNQVDVVANLFSSNGFGDCAAMVTGVVRNEELESYWMSALSVLRAHEGCWHVLCYFDSIMQPQRARRASLPRAGAGSSCTLGCWGAGQLKLTLYFLPHCGHAF
jgi:hypothetical protein